MRGHAVAQKRDAKENVMGWAHWNSISDTRMYQVEFPGVKVAKWSIHVIVESSYTQYDAWGKRIYSDTYCKTI